MTLKSHLTFDQYFNWFDSVARTQTIKKKKKKTRCIFSHNYADTICHTGQRQNCVLFGLKGVARIVTRMYVSKSQA